MTDSSDRRLKPVIADGQKGEPVELVGDEERVDPAWEQGNADRARELWPEQRRAMTDSLKAHRRRQPLHHRLRDVFQRAASYQSQKGRAYDTEKVGGGGDQWRPSGGDDLAIAGANRQEVERRLRSIERHIERLEQLCDVHEGIASDVNYAAMGKEDKDAVILREFVGWRPEDVADFEPALGAARTIRWVRQQKGLRGVCGHDPARCDCQGVRKAPTR